MAALTGAAVGGTVGGLTGALIGMGIPEYEAKRYEGKVKGGNALISVHSEDSAETDRAKKIFEAAVVKTFQHPANRGWQSALVAYGINQQIRRTAGKFSGRFFTPTTVVISKIDEVTSPPYPIQKEQI